MPDMDGLSLCRHVRTTGRGRSVYVLMLTVRDRKEDLLMGLAAGVDDYIVKGVPVEEILARVEVARRIAEREATAAGDGHLESARDSETDTLTGAYSLGYLMKYLPRELERSRRYGHALAVLHCDLDGFRSVNENLGRNAADELLRAFVARVRSCTRKNCDWLARVGGDEFLIVLPETSVSGSNRVAQKLREVLARHPVATNVGPVNFTASIGITTIEPKYEYDEVLKLDDVLRAASRGLRSSKGRGGNSATAAAVTSDVTIALGWQMEEENESH
jgi:two-component system, cell cycle response regulator